MTSGLWLRSAKRATLGHIAPAPPPLSLRLGREGLRALEDLARIRGIGKAEAARQAIQETAQREQARRDLAAEASRLLADPEYVNEARVVSELMEELRGPG